MSELKVSLSKIPAIWCDNLSTVLLTANPVLHAPTKHIELYLYFVREKVLQKKVDVRHVHVTDQTAYIFTRAIPSTRFPFIRDKLKVLGLDTLSLRGC